MNSFSSFLLTLLSGFILGMIFLATLEFEHFERYAKTGIIQHDGVNYRIERMGPKP